MTLGETMNLISFEILKGHRYRGLFPWNGFSRIEFKQKCFAIIDSAEQACREAGGNEEDCYEAKKQAMRALAESSLFFFCIVVLEMSFVDNDFCFRLCMDVQENKWNRLWVIAREHFKTTIITEASTLWELSKDPELTYLINSYNIMFSTTCVDHIRTYCETCTLLHELWPEIFWKDPARGYEDNEDGTRTTWTWTKSKIELRRKNHPKEMTIEAGAIEGAGQTGGHFARIIYDDAETPKTVETAQSIEKAYNKIMLAVNTGKTTDLNICFVGTFYARDDMYVKMIRNKVVIEAVIQPCCEKDGTPICYPVEILEKKIAMMGPDAAYTQMFCDPSVTSAASFDPKWIKRWIPKIEPGQNTYIFVDPAGSKQKSTNDNTVMIVVSIDGMGNMLLHDMVRDKLTQMQKFQYLSTFYAKYRPIQTFYEEESMQADIAMMENFMSTYNMRFPITPFSMKKFGKKEHRISKLVTPFSRGRIYLPENAYHTNYLGKDEDMIASFVAEEYMGFPIIQHDDALDILATAYIYLEAGYISSPLVSIPSPYERDHREVFFNPISNRYVEVEEAEYIDCFEGM